MTEIPNGLKIYREAFGEENGFDKRLFEAYGDIAEYLFCRDTAVSMLFPIPCSLILPDKKIPAKYIFAAATDRQYRGQGYMSNLIERVCRDKDTFFFLRPASDSLTAYYQKLGFKAVQGFGDEAAMPKISVLPAHMALAGEVLEGGEFTLMYRYLRPLQITELHFGYSMF